MVLLWYHGIIFWYEEQRIGPAYRPRKQAQKPIYIYTAYRLAYRRCAVALACNVQVGNAAILKKPKKSCKSPKKINKNL